MTFMTIPIFNYLTMKISEINITLATATLKGDLALPENAIGLVIFSHGSGSSRLSSRNRLVAELLQKQNIGTFLFDLLTEEEDQIYENRFNIDLLLSRLIETTNWLIESEKSKGLPLGYFGASTGAASALRAAAFFGETINAVVSRGGRPDLALNELHLVTAPTLLIVGGDDVPVIGMNKLAFDALECIKEMKIIPGATHLFEEPGKLVAVSGLAIDWYKKYLVREQN